MPIFPQDNFLWTNQDMYDTLRVNKPPLSEKQTIDLTVTFTQLEQQKQGNILQFLENGTWDAFPGGGLVTVQFNEPTAPEYVVRNNQTFIFPFYRFFLNNYAAQNGVSLIYTVHRECMISSAFGISAGGPKIEQINQFERVVTEQWAVAGAGGTHLVVPTWGGGGSGVLYVRSLRVMNTDQNNMVELQNYLGGGTGNYPLYPTQEMVFNFAGSWKMYPLTWGTAGTPGRNLRIINNNVAAVDVRAMFFYSVGSDYAGEV